MGIFDFFKGGNEEAATDPICKMKVSKKDAKFTFDYENKTYYFCSGHCLATFKESPKEYYEKTG